MSDHERELRDVLRSRGDAVPVGRADETGLLRRLAAARRRRQQTRLLAATAALVMVLGGVTLVATKDDQTADLVAGPGPSTSTSMLEPSSTSPARVPVETSLPQGPTSPAPPVTSTSTTPTAPTTSGPKPTTTTAAPLPALPDDALWPPPGSTTTFSSPDKAAFDFARRYLEMPNSQVGSPRISGAEATIDVAPNGGPSFTTVVTLRRVEVRGWIVVGCAAPKIEVSQPTAGATISSPLTVRGRAEAWEGNVIVEVRRDWSTTPIGSSFGTGSTFEQTPFEATVTFTRPTSTRGTVIVYEPRVDDVPGPMAATVVRVRF